MESWLNIHTGKVSEKYVHLYIAYVPFSNSFFQVHLG